MLAPEEEEAVAEPTAPTELLPPARSSCSALRVGWLGAWAALPWRCHCRRRCQRCGNTSGNTVAPADGTIGSDGGETVANAGGGSGKCTDSDTGKGRRPSMGASMFVLSLSGKFKRGNLLRRREKQQQQQPRKPKAAIGVLNELAALSSRDIADESYVKQLQCARHHKLSLVFEDPRFERKYEAYHHAHWTLTALRERLLKFMGAFSFYAAFEDLLGSVQDAALGSKLVAYTIMLALFLGCAGLGEALRYLETRQNANTEAAIRMRLPLHTAFTVAWVFMLLGMAVHFEEVRYLSALLMPLLYAHSILHFRWLGHVYLFLAVAFETTWVVLLDGWNIEREIAKRGHSLHGVLVIASSLFFFVKYCELQYKCQLLFRIFY